MKKLLVIFFILILFPLSAIAQTETEFNLENLFLGEQATSLVAINNFNLIWSVDTYTPYNYEGRNLPSRGSEIRVEAIISVSSGSPNNLKYSWFLEGVFQRSKSGYGKDVFSFSAVQRPGGFHIIKLQIFNDDRSVFQEKSIQIPVVSPEIIVYPSNGNSHFSNQASKISTVLSNKEFSFIAKPYFFSIKRLIDLTFEWNFPGKEPIISSDYNASVLSLTVSSNKLGELIENDLRVNAKNTKDPRQEASQIIKLNIY